MTSVRAGSEVSHELGPDDNVKDGANWVPIKDDASVGEPSARLAESQANKPVMLRTVGDPMLPLDDPRYWAAKWLAPAQRDWRRRGGAALLLVLSGLVGGGCATALAIYLMGSQGGHLADMTFRQEPTRASPMPRAREESGQAPADALATAATGSVGPGGLAAQSDAAVEPTEAPKSAAAAQPAEPEGHRHRLDAS